MSTNLVPRATVETLVAHRNHALQRFGEAHTALGEADAALQAAWDALRAGVPGANAYNHHLHETRSKFVGSIKFPDRDEYLATARRIIDTDVWAHVIQLTELEKLMDKTAKDQFRQQLIQDPPEATVDNIFATIRQFALDADEIFARGIAECFSNLDRRFRSHDGWKIGGRVILDRAFDEWGHWSYYRNQRDTIMDVERTFCVLDGEPPPEVYGGLIGAIEHARRNGNLRPRQTELDTEYFRVRIYKNGNCHLWFQRPDLVEKVNKILADYYGEVIPDGRDPEDDGGLFTPKTTPAKYYGFYPTPEDAARQVIATTPLYRRDDEPPVRVLEPSAGTGNLARLCARKGAAVDCVEVQPHLAAQLKAEGLYRRVTEVDFLALTPDPENLYDVVCMNPPFDMERDIDHVVHALGFLKPTGTLVAIMSAGTEFRETRKAKAFRALIEKLSGRFRDLPARSFASVGTNVNTVILKVQKDGSRFYW